MIAAHAGGIPRNIGNICFNAISLGCATKQKTIDDNIIQEVLSDLDLNPLYEDSTDVSKREAVQPPVLRVRLNASSSWSGWALARLNELKGG
jgi:hypothetical protein